MSENAPPSDGKDPVIHRQRAVAVVVEGGRLLLHANVSDDFWALPGGAVEEGETPEDALERELREELAQTARIGGTVCVFDNAFVYGGRHYRERGFYLRVTIEGLPASGPFTGQEPHLIFDWFDAARFAATDFRPRALRETLTALIAA